jgi:hypothetical protein
MRTAFRIGIAVALVAVSAGVPWVLQHQAQVELRTRRAAWEQQASRLSLLVQENGRLSNLVAQAKASSPLTTEQLRELLRLRNEKRWLAEQTNLAARLATGTSDQAQLSPAELKTALCAEMAEAMKRILPALQPALQKYALAHPDQPPDSFSELQDYFPLVAGRKMVGLQTFEFAREGGPRPGDALLLRGSPGSRPRDGSEVRIYGFSDGRAVEVSSEDGHFDDWEAQHLSSALGGTEEKISLEAKETTQERARVAEIGVSVGISAEDAGRFFDRVRQQQKVLGQRFEEMEKSLTGSPEEKHRQMRAAVEKELNKLAIETLGDKGPALVKKMGVLK